MTRPRWVWGGVITLAVAALAWRMLPPVSTAGETGVIRITSTPTPAVEAPVAVKATPRTPQKNSELADANHDLLLREKRDRDWADRSEAAIQAFMRGLAHVDSRTVVAKCTTTACEVSGLASEDPATGSMVPIWEGLDRDSAGDGLARQGLERIATIFGTGRAREEFVIHYRRVQLDGASYR